MNKENINVYDRDALYNEVWEEPVIKVAKKYGVSDVAIHKVCKSLNIPVPPRGYWAKLKYGKKVKKTPLTPSKNIISEKTGSRTYQTSVDNIEENKELLSFMADDDKLKVFNTAKDILSYDSESRLHKAIQEHKKIVSEWNKNNRSIEGSSTSISDYKSGYYRNRERAPQLAGVIAKDSLSRAYRFLDALFKLLETLGCTINSDLSIEIRGETVKFEMYEMQTKTNHELTKQEIKALESYEIEVKRYSWTSKPKIRKYEHAFNGRLCFSPKEHVYYRDSENSRIEEKLGKIIIDLFEESEVVRIDREKREEKQRQQEEEQKRKELAREKYNNEVENTIALENAAMDFETAYRIRAYVNEIESKDVNKENAEWIKWAKEKADWYDPTISREDELFGEREHSLSKEEKTLQKHSRWY